MKNKKGSVLVFSLFLMMISLIIGVSMMSTSVTARRSTLSSSKSVYSFQMANDGIEFAFFTIKEKKASLGLLNGKDIGVIFSGCGGSGEIIEPYPPSGSYNVTFYDNTSSQLSCSDKIEEVTIIKSIGTYRDVSRAVESTIDLSDPSI